jgi:outer membrane protein, adhesin transport system
MRKPAPRPLANLSLFTLLFAALAQSGQAKNQLDIFATMSRVDSTHPSVEARRKALTAAESNRTGAWQQMLPSLSASRSRGNTDEKSQLTTATLQQPLFTGGRIVGGIDQANALLDESQAGLTQVRRDLMSRTAGVYIEVVKAREKLKVAEKNVSAHQELLASIDRRVGSEISPESDRTLTQSRLSQAQSERAQIALSLQLAEDNLRELLADELPQLVPPSHPPQEVTELMQALEQGMSFAPELRQLDAQEATAKSEITIRRAALFPSFFVRHDQLSGDRGNLPRSQTFLGVEFAPGAGFSVGSQIKAAEQRRLAAVDGRRAAEKDVRDQIRTLWAEREALRTQAQSALAYVKSSQSVADSFARQFTIGRKTWLEVLNSKREALLAEINHTEVAWNALRASYQLEIQTGRLTPEQIASTLSVPQGNAQ